jgi:GDP-L-fucose synthase
MKVFVTGATGFLGTALCRALSLRGDEVVGVGSKECDLRKGDSLHGFNGQAYERIYHLAAWTQAGDFCLGHPGEQWIMNQLINSHVLQWWQEEQPQAKLIAIGTSCSYAPNTELVEENYLVGEPIESLYTYAMTKRMLYIGMRALGSQFGLRYLYVVPSTLYGTGYRMDGRQMHFIFDLIGKIVRGKRYNEPVVLWGDGWQQREVTHVDDFVGALVFLAEGRNNDLVNIGTGEQHTIRDFAQRICEKVGYDFSLVQFDTSRYVGARCKCLNIGKLKVLMPGYGTRELDGGLAQTIDWFMQQGDGEGCVADRRQVA